MNITQLKNSALAVAAAAAAGVGQLMGGWDEAIRVLVALMGLDYLTGMLLALVWKRSPKSESGALDSRAGFKGLVKKGMMLLLVWLGVLLDGTLGTDYIRLAVILFFVGNEGLSLLENLGLMGVPFPGFLKNALEALREEGDNAKA